VYPGLFDQLERSSGLCATKYSGKSVCPRAGLLKSHSPWYRRIQTSTCRQAREPLKSLKVEERSRDKSHNRIQSSRHESAQVEDYTLRQRRGESSQVRGDQSGRDGGTKKLLLPLKLPAGLSTLELCTERKWSRSGQVRFRVERKWTRSTLEQECHAIIKICSIMPPSLRRIS
jgi:hypothetical protein